MILNRHICGSSGDMTDNNNTIFTDLWLNCQWWGDYRELQAWSFLYTSVLIFPSSVGHMQHFFYCANIFLSCLQQHLNNFPSLPSFNKEPFFWTCRSINCKFSGRLITILVLKWVITSNNNNVRRNDWKNIVRSY